MCLPGGFRQIQMAVHFTSLHHYFLNIHKSQARGVRTNHVQYMDTSGQLTSQNLRIAQTNLCVICKTHVCVGERVTGATRDSCAGHFSHEHRDPVALVPTGCFHPPSCVVRPECPVQQHRSVSAFTRAARYTELTEKQPTILK